jgi:hypothetical protein
MADAVSLSDDDWEVQLGHPYLVDTNDDGNRDIVQVDAYVASGPEDGRIFNEIP